MLNVLFLVLVVTKFANVGGMILVTLSCDAWMVPTNPSLCSEAYLMNKSSCLVPALVVTKFANVRGTLLVTLCCDARMFNKPISVF